MTAALLQGGSAGGSAKEANGSAAAAAAGAAVGGASSPPVHPLLGPREVVGSMSSGGSESIVLAVKATRDFMREKRGITRPEM